MTVFELLKWSANYLKDHQIDNPPLNAELLLAHSLNLSREALYAHLYDPLKEKEKAMVEQLIKRRISGEPLQYILKQQEFWSIDFKVDPRVLIPRPETEFLVEQSLLVLSKALSMRTPLALEIGTGSGAIAISLAKEIGNIFLVATDISMGALVLAKGNAQSAGVLHQIEFVNSDLFAPFRLFKATEPFDLILSNPPYITHSEIDFLAREVRDYEPIVALDGGEDGFEFYRRITQEASFYLRKGGWLLLEIGQGQGSKVLEMIEKEGYFNIPETIQDLSGIERVVKAQKRG